MPRLKFLREEWKQMNEKEHSEQEEQHRSSTCKGTAAQKNSTRLPSGGTTMWPGPCGGREAGNEAESGRGEAGAVPLTNTGRSRKMKTEPGTPPSVASQCPPDQMNPVNPDKEQCQVNPDKEHGQTDTRGRIINLRQLLCRGMQLRTQSPPHSATVPPYFYRPSIFSP